MGQWCFTCGKPEVKGLFCEFPADLFARGLPWGDAQDRMS